MMQGRGQQGKGNTEGKGGAGREGGSNQRNGGLERNIIVGLRWYLCVVLVGWLGKMKQYRTSCTGPAGALVPQTRLRRRPQLPLHCCCYRTPLALTYVKAFGKGAGHAGCEALVAAAPSKRPTWACLLGMALQARHGPSQAGACQRMGPASEALGLPSSPESAGKEPARMEGSCHTDKGTACAGGSQHNSTSPQCPAAVHLPLSAQHACLATAVAAAIQPLPACLPASQLALPKPPTNPAPPTSLPQLPP